MLVLRVDCRVTIGGNQNIQCHVKEVKTYKHGPRMVLVAGWLFKFVEALTKNGKVGRFTLKKGNLKWHLP